MDEELGELTQDDFIIPPVKYECKFPLLFIINLYIICFFKSGIFALTFCTYETYLFVSDLDHTADVQ